MSSIFGLDSAKHLYRNNNFLSDGIRSAIQFANNHHAGQIRKSLDKEPVIFHCLNVGNTLARVNSPEETIIAGILHDTIEDTTVKKADLIHKFGSKVANLVNDVTEQNPKASWLKRCYDYNEHLRTSPRAALCISAADKIDNMASMTDSIKRHYNIFKNMEGTPNMQLEKFQGVYRVIKGKIPIKLEKLYKKTLIKFIRTMKRFKYLK